MAGEAQVQHDGAQSVREVANILGTTPEPEQPTGATQDVENNQELKKTPPGDNDSGPRRFTAKLGDQDVVFDLITEGVDPSLVSKGMMFENDYRKKTAEVAENRRAAESRMTELVEALDDAKSLLEMDLDALEANTELKDLDPEEYVKQLDAITARTKKYNDRRTQLSAEQATKAEQNRATQQQLLSDAIPDWLDEAVKDSDIKLMVKAMDSVGFDTEGIGGIDDHKVFLLARKAAKYDEIMGKDLKAKEENNAGITLKPGAAKGDKSGEQITAARERLKTGGRVSDLADVFAGR
jgi:hypothetical protein